MKIATNILAGILPVIVLVWVLNLPGRFNLLVYPEQMLAVVFGLSLALAFLLRDPAGRVRADQAGIGLIDCVGAVLALCASLYVAVAFPQIAETIYLRPAGAVAAGIVLILLTLETLRRLIGWGITSILAVFLVYAVFGHHLPSVLQARENSIARLAVYLSIDSNGMYGVPLKVSATTVLVFIFFGVLLTRSGGGQFFTDIAMAGFGRFRGGAAKMSITASALFGTISGSAVANVASTGVVTIPMMKRSGYEARSAAAIEAVVSTGGQLMPPVMGAAAFLMAELLQISYATIAAAALLPALFYYVSVFLQADLVAARDDIRALNDGSQGGVYKTMREGWPFVLPFAALLAGLFVFLVPPETAAIFACAIVLGVGILHRYKGQGISLRDLPGLLVAGGISSVEIILIGAAAGLVVGILNVTALSFSLTLNLVMLAQGSLVLLLVLAAVLATILGMGMPTISVYILLAALLAPSLVQMGANEIAAHLFVQYFGMLSMLTPPVALAAFTAAIIGKAGPTEVAFRAIRFGWAAFLIPFLFVADPALIMQGPALHVAVAAARTIAGLWLVNGAVVGYLGGRLDPALRGVVLVAGLQVLVPLTILPGGIPTGLLSLTVAAIVLAVRLARRNTPGA